MVGRPRVDTDLDRRIAEHALDVLARRRTTMPLTAGFLQAVLAQGFNHKVGRKRAAAMRTHLTQSGRLTPVGRYRGAKHGYWVTVWRVLHRVAPVLSSVRKKSRVKGSKPWWEHPLFGNPGGKPPPGTSERQIVWWKSDLWLIGERSWDRETGRVHSFVLA